jgi:hypothetical protein
MSEQQWERPTADPRHPWWCDPAHCEWSQPWLGDHRSAPVPIVGEKSYSADTVLWLSQPIHQPLTAGEVMLNMRITLTVHGEVETASSWSFVLTEAQQTAAVMTLLARRGEERRYVADEVWRAGVTPPPKAQPGPGEPGNAGPGLGALPGEVTS